MNRVSVDLLNACVTLDKSTGYLYWKNRPVWTFNQGKYDIKREAHRWNSRHEGFQAFNTLSKYGYLSGRLSGVSLYSHRVVWAVYHGDFPELWLDHLDGNRSNNKIENLREVSYKDNNKNSSLRSDNKTGCVGVTVRQSKFIVNIKDCFGKQIQLGTFKTLEEAIFKRKSAEADYGYHVNHGKSKNDHY